MNDKKLMNLAADNIRILAASMQAERRWQQLLLLGAS